MEISEDNLLIEHKNLYTSKVRKSGDMQEEFLYVTLKCLDNNMVKIIPDLSKLFFFFGF